MRHVIVDGKVVVRNRQLTTIDETEIYDAVKVVMMAELDIERLPLRF